MSQQESEGTTNTMMISKENSNIQVHCCNGVLEYYSFFKIWWKRRQTDIDELMCSSLPQSVKNIYHGYELLKYV